MTKTIYKLPNDLSFDLLELEKLINDFNNGNIDKHKLRAFRVPMGIYEQRQDDTYMVRIRLPGGNLSLSQFEQLLIIASKYTYRDLHITTRQEIQLHNIKLNDMVDLIRELIEIGLITKGGGGNSVRNITGSYDSGISDNEVFDITPYVIGLTERMIEEKDSWRLPRKFKIAFSNSQNDTGLATVNDLGFIAKINENGEKGFSVYIAGGMGANANIGIKVFDFISDKEVYNITKAAKILFDKYGNRKNRHKARLRFVLYNLGIEKFKKIFYEEYENIKKNNYEPLFLKNIEINNKGFLEIPIFLGDLSVDNAKKITNIAKNLGEFSLRFTPRQNIIIKNIPFEKITEIKKQLEFLGLLETKNEFLNNAVVCAGASTCRLGICLSRNLLKAIKDKCNKLECNFKKIKNIKINISGCPNSCGQHLIADIGFFGKAKNINGKYAPFYNVVAGAKIKADETKFAEKIGEIPAFFIPEFLIEFFIITENEKRIDEDFYNYLKRFGKEILVDLINKYNRKFSEEENEKFYYDWGDTKKFSMLEKLEGECSAGLFDLIDYDFRIAEEKINKKEFREAIIYISRALLITKGIEIKNEADAPNLFKDNFIGKHIDEKFLYLIEKFEKNEQIIFEEAFHFYDAVKKLYEQMDNSLKFPEIKKDDTENIKKMQFVFKDFRGIPCPINFVKTKLELEKMNKGEKLKILLDDGQPIENVPASIKAEGHKILQTNKINDYWEVIIEKGE